MQKIIIYQVFTRLFGNDNTRLVPDGDKAVNGCGRMADFSTKALDAIRGLGATHIWYTGIIEHATQTDYTSYGISLDHPAIVKGKAGSPYAIKDYYDVDPDLATDVPNRMREFQNLVHRTHQAGLRVIMDFVPNHVARQYHSDACPDGVQDLGATDDTQQAFSTQNNFYYIPGEPLRPDFDLQGYTEFPARATGNDVFSACPSRNDWYETVKLNYGVDVMGGRVGHFDPIPSTWEKMLQILLFWAQKGVDGFRCDMAEMVPVEFWQWVIPQVKAQFPDLIFIAEVYNPAEYRNYIHQGHFDYLYDKVGLYDCLKAITQGWQSAQTITQCWQSVDDIRNHMLNFLENHDEQRLASDFFAGDARRGRAPLLVSTLMGRNPMMVYFGQELGERGMDAEGFSGRDGRTTIFDYWSVDTIRRCRNHGKMDGNKLTDEERSLQSYYRQVLTLANQNEALRSGDFYDLMYVNTQLKHQYAFVRHTSQETLVVIANFQDDAIDIQLNIPAHIFEFFSLQEKQNATWTDLMTGESQQTDFCPSIPANLTISPLGGAIFRLK